MSAKRKKKESAAPAAPAPEPAAPTPAPDVAPVAPTEEEKPTMATTTKKTRRDKINARAAYWASRDPLKACAELVTKDRDGVGPREIDEARRYLPTPDTTGDPKGAALLLAKLDAVADPGSYQDDK